MDLISFILLVMLLSYGQEILTGLKLNQEQCQEVSHYWISLESSGLLCDLELYSVELLGVYVAVKRSVIEGSSAFHKEGLEVKREDSSI